MYLVPNFLDSAASAAGMSKGIWNNTGETRQSFGRCFSNFMGLPKNNLLGGDVDYLGGGLSAPSDLLYFFNISN